MRKVASTVKIVILVIVAVSLLLLALLLNQISRLIEGVKKHFNKQFVIGSAIILFLSVLSFEQSVSASSTSDIDWFYATRCLINLKNNGEFTLGISVGKKIEDAVAEFETDPKGGRLQFLIMNNQVRLIRAIPPLDSFLIFENSEPANSSPEWVLSQFLRADFPEEIQWEIQSVKEISDSAGHQLVVYQCQGDKTKLCLSISIWLKIVKVVALELLPPSQGD